METLHGEVCSARPGGLLTRYCGDELKKQNSGAIPVNHGIEAG